MLVPLVKYQQTPTCIKIAAPAKQGSPHHWKFSNAHTGPRFAHGFNLFEYIRSYNEIVQATSRGLKKSRAWTCSQCRARRRQTENMWLKVDSYQA
jgi:hypothetical protein